MLYVEKYNVRIPSDANRTFIYRIPKTKVIQENIIKNMSKAQIAQHET